MNHQLYRDPPKTGIGLRAYRAEAAALVLESLAALDRVLALDMEGNPPASAARILIEQFGARIEPLIYMAIRPAPRDRAESAERQASPSCVCRMEHDPQDSQNVLLICGHASLWIPPASTQLYACNVCTPQGVLGIPPLRAIVAFCEGSKKEETVTPSP